MAIYDDRLQTHPVWASLAAAREGIAVTADKLADPEQIELHAHIETILTYLGLRLDGLDAQIANFAAVDGINTNLQQLAQSLQQFEENPGNRSILDQADNQAAGILAYLGQFPPPTDVETENLREIGTNYRRSMSGHVGRLTAEAHQLTARVEELSQQVVLQKEQIDAEAGRLEQALATTAATFEQAQTVREEAFTKQRTDFETELKELIDTATNTVTASVTTNSDSVADSIKSSRDATTEALKEMKEKADAAWAEIAALRVRAETASNYLGINSLAGGYHTTADAEENRAFWLRVSAIACFLGAIGVSAFALIYHVYHAFSLEGFFAKAAVSLPILLLAAYLAREASHHNDRANFSRQRQRQLESLPAYVDGLEPAKRALLYEALAPGFFGPVTNSNRDKDGERGTDPVGGAISLLIEEAKKRA